MLIDAVSSLLLLIEGWPDPSSMKSPSASTEKSEKSTTSPWFSGYSTSSKFLMPDKRSLSSSSDSERESSSDPSRKLNFFWAVDKNDGSGLLVCFAYRLQNRGMGKARQSVAHYSAWEIRPGSGSGTGSTSLHLHSEESPCCEQPGPVIAQLSVV
jgi:hypothetical protein